MGLIFRSNSVSIWGFMETFKSIRPAALLWAAVLTICCNDAGAQTPSNTLAGLQARMEAHVSQARFAQAQWGVKVVSLASGQTVFDHNGNKLMKPASNAKMYTTSLALDRLGPDYRIKTSFYASDKPDATGTIHGDLIVYGRGDPCFSARFNDEDYNKILTPVISALMSAGVKRIEGDLVGDDSYFRGAPYGTEWTWDDLQNYYGAPVSALSIQDNVIDLVFKPGAAIGQPCRIVTMPETSFMVFSNRTKTVAAKGRASIDMYKPLNGEVTYVWGQVPLDSKGAEDSISVSNPALWFVSLLKDALARNGITVTGCMRSVNWLDREVTPLDFSRLVEVASVQSRPISEIVKRTLKPSENQYAQLLLLQVGAHAETGGETRNTESEGLSEMRKFLEEAGIPRGMTLLQEGSGLSRAALVTPSASVQLLTYMSKHRCHDIFYDGLPIAGVDGTLRNRFKGTAGAGNIHAKTGSLGFVDTLSGYLTTRGGDKLAFSVMLNNYRGTGRHADGRAEIDALVTMLVNYSAKLP